MSPRMTGDDKATLMGILRNRVLSEGGKREDLLRAKMDLETRGANKGCVGRGTGGHRQ